MLYQEQERKTLNGFKLAREPKLPGFTTGWQHALQAMRYRLPVLSNPGQKANKGAAIWLWHYYETITGEFMKNGANGLYFYAVTLNSKRK